MFRSSDRCRPNRLLVKKPQSRHEVRYPLDGLVHRSETRRETRHPSELASPSSVRWTPRAERSLGKHPSVVLGSATEDALRRRPEPHSRSRNATSEPSRPKRRLCFVFHRVARSHPNRLRRPEEFRDTAPKLSLPVGCTEAEAPPRTEPIQSGMGSSAKAPVQVGS